jgi:hypothetical protein
MKRLLPNLSALLFFLIVLSYIIIAEPVDKLTAHRIASGKIRSLDKFREYSIVANGFEYSNESGDNLLFYFRMEPTGYVVISADDCLPPVVAYSFEDKLPEIIPEGNPLLSLLVADLSLRMENLKFLPASVIANRKNTWKQLELVSVKGKSNPLFQQWPPEGTTSTGGWLETNWTQTAPYNNFCPMDPVTNQRSIAGCPATAMAQILNYFKTTNATNFSDNDDYYHAYAGRNYWIDNDCVAIDFPCFVDLNAYLDTITMSFDSNSNLKNSGKAALTFACGVAAHQVYTSQVSGTFSVDQAEDAYLRFGFSESLLLENTDTSLFTLLSKNMMEARPAHLAIVDPGWTMGHNVVVDGYNTDDYYHLNFGWGGGYNGWYLLPDEIPYGLTVIEGLIVNIAQVPINTGLAFYPANNADPTLKVYPNPITDEFNAAFSISQMSHVKIDVVDINGTLVISFREKIMNPGLHTISYKLNKNQAWIGPGIFICRFQVDDKVITQKFIVR